MNARHFREMYGQKLINQRVLTEPIGGYPGGVAVVTELDPDPAATEIVMMVRHLTWTDHDGDNTMGIFEWEEISLAPRVIGGLLRPWIQPEVL